MNIEKYLKDKREIVEKYLDLYIPLKKEYPSIIHKSMRYSIFSEGKRFRPILAIAVCEACGGKLKDVIATACALEIIHTYSLIHDDLPAMDNDDFRRGQLSNHKKFDEYIAILAGDALLTLAFEIMHKDVVKDIAKAIGSLGVVGGQVVDMQLANKELELTQPLIEYIHTHKTGALIAVSCKAGAVLAGASSKVVNAINKFGEDIGFAFQIIDDIFDNENYAVLVGEKEAQKNAEQFIANAKKQIKNLNLKKPEILFALADYVGSRKN